MSIAYNREDRIASIRLGPSAGVTFTPETRRDLNDALQRYRDDADAWIAVIHCDGPDFCPGSDSADASTAARRERARLYAGGYVEVWKPVIAVVQGACSGEGLALALSCDLRVAEPAARFTFAAASDDPGVSAVWLANLVGASLAFELTWLGRSLDAAAAQRLGLVNRLVEQAPLPPPAPEEGRFPMLVMRSTIESPGGDAYGGALHFARELLQYAPVTRNFQKQTALRSIGVPFFYAQTLELGINPYASEDRVEGGRAFVENRRPVWSNR